MVNQSIEKQPLGALFKSNFASGLVVFLVALPLCLGLAPLMHVREQVVFGRAGRKILPARTKNHLLAV